MILRADTSKFIKLIQKKKYFSCQTFAYIDRSILFKMRICGIHGYNTVSFRSNNANKINEIEQWHVKIGFVTLLHIIRTDNTFKMTLRAMGTM